jgi:restriction system protein
MPNITIWGIHMGKHVAHRPVEEGFIAIGWQEFGDPQGLPDTSEAFKQRVRDCYPGIGAGKIPVWAGQLRRFVYSMKVGDLIVYPSKHDRLVNVGRIASNSRYVADSGDGYPNRREVDWLAHVPRDQLRQSALYEIGSALTLFQVKTHSADFSALASGKMPTGTIVSDETTVDDESATDQVTQQAEEGAADFIIRRLNAGLSGAAFEEFVAHLLECMGYNTRFTPVTGDGGVDIIAHKDPLGLQPPIVKVQCKRTSGTSAEADINQLLGTLGDGEYGLFVTLGSFTRNARVTERGRPKLRLIDGDELVRLVFEHYPKFNSRFRALLPLKQVYLPDIGRRE